MAKGRKRKSSIVRQGQAYDPVVLDYSKVIRKNSYEVNRFKAFKSHISPGEAIRSATVRRATGSQTPTLIQSSILPARVTTKRKTLRLDVTRSECQRRKDRKKAILKAVAAQISRKGGNMAKWRKRRSQINTIAYRC